MKKIVLVFLSLTAFYSAFAQDFHIVTTGDVHGSYFNRPFVGGKYVPSLMSVKHYVDSLRAVAGPENVLLLDAGDCLQGNNASYYFNYVATDRPHIYPRLAAYMGYDACTVGNHDIEAGHPVYDRVKEELSAAGIPWLAGNAFREDGSLYFPEYVLLDKGGRKVLVLGYNNANIDNWLSEELWSGMHHESLVPLVRKRAAALKKQFKPDILVVVVHSGTGRGDGSSYENQGLDIFKFLNGVDVLVTAHDHVPACIYARNGKSWLVNGGARCGNVGHVVLHFEDDKISSRHGEYVRLDKMAVDERMVQEFDSEYREVKDFTVQPVGRLELPLATRDAYAGMNPYIDLIHTVQLDASGAKVSLAAPLTYNGYVKAGELVFNDMFTIYPFENQLYTLMLTGKEIRGLLEYSYSRWVVAPGEHVLFINDTPDPRTGAPRWSFVHRSYNFDSAAGINYTVDVTKPVGDRVHISGFADGTPFEETGEYIVAMTSYRANGGGDLLTYGAGIPHNRIAERIIDRYPEIRDLIYQFIKTHGTVDESLISNRAVLGSWMFVPQDRVAPLMSRDLQLVF